MNYRRIGRTLIVLALALSVSAAGASAAVYGARTDSKTGSATGAETGVKYVAHRGYAYHARENTAKAFRLAGRHHFWGTECDIYETKHTAGGSFDLVLHHDDNFKRVYGVNRKVRSMTAKQMKKAFGDITFFGEYADICAEYGMCPVVEYKDKHMSDAAIRRSVDILHDRGLLEQAYLQSFEMRNLKKIRAYVRKKYHTEPAMIYLIKGSRSSVYKGVKRARSNGIDRVSIKKTRIDQRVCRFCKKHKMRISAWTFHQNEGKRAYAADQKLLRKLISKYHLEMAVVESRNNNFN